MCPDSSVFAIWYVCEKLNPSVGHVGYDFPGYDTVCLMQAKKLPRIIVAKACFLINFNSIKIQLSY